MAAIDDLNAAVQSVSDGLTLVQTDIETVIADFKAASGAVDLSGPIAKLQSIATNLGTLDATVKAAIPPAA